MGYVLGFDIGGTKCAVLLARIQGSIEILERRDFPTRQAAVPRQAVDRMIALAREMMAAHGGVLPIALGVSCGGPLNEEQGRVLSPPHLPGWDDVPVTDWLQEALGAPAYLQNDANACALVEWMLGAGRGARNMVFCTMGTGFGAGIIAEGKLLSGATGLSGEIGHVRLTPDGPEGYRKQGAVEGYCSGAGIAGLARLHTEKCLREGRTPQWTSDGCTAGQLDAKLVAKYAGRGDPDGIEVYRQAGEKLGHALAILLDVLNPEKVVIGSIFARCEMLLRPAMEKALREEALPGTVASCRIVPAQTGERLGDLASLMVACRGAGYPVLAEEDTALEGEAKRQLDELLGRYPVLGPCRKDIAHTFALLKQMYAAGGKLLVCGNGGSAADADHIVGELMKGFYLQRPVCRKDGRVLENLQGALPAVSLTHHAALSTAFANDVSAEHVFAQQVYGYGRKGDILLAISTSGNAKNVNRAAETARYRSMPVIGLTGEDGGALAGQCAVCIRVPARVTAQVQELHLPVYHTLCAMLECEFFGATEPKPGR